MCMMKSMSCLSTLLCLGRIHFHVPKWFEWDTIVGFNVGVKFRWDAYLNAKKTSVGVDIHPTNRMGIDLLCMLIIYVFSLSVIYGPSLLGIC